MKIDSFQTRRAAATIVSVALALTASVAQAQQDLRPLRIFAAASLTGALPDALRDWPGEMVLVHAGSSTLARQIEQGAEADIFISADPDWVAYLSDAGRVEGEAVELLGNALVVVASAETEPGAAPPFPEGALLAVADTAAAPAGRYARRALEAAEDWPPKARLLQTSHVREALAWAARGEVDFAIVYRSDAASEPRVKVIHEFGEDPAHPILYAGVVIEGAQENAAKALEFLRSAPAQAIFAGHGFTPLHE